MELLDVLPGIDDEVYNIVENNIITEKINKIINEKLPKREAEIIKLRYGIGGKPALTQREVAKKLNISRSYISRLETKAIAVIKEELGDFSIK